jgi:hypothetical protein
VPVIESSSKAALGIAGIGRTMVEKDSVAIARLELLSNTAMLRKVLDRKSQATAAKSEKKAQRPDQLSKDSTPSTVSVPSPTSTSLFSESNQRGESPSPHTILDSSRDAPPLAHERPAYAPIPPPYYHFNRVVEMDASREPNMRREGAALTYGTGSGAPQRGYMHGGRGDMYFGENRSVAHAAPPQMAHHQHPPRGRPPYPMKENVPPRPYHGGPGMYSNRPIMDVRHSAMPPEAMYVPGPPTSCEDHDDSRKPSYETLMRENFHMLDQLKEKDTIVSSLQLRVNYLEEQINELCQLPTGKISHIPLE